MVEVLGLLGILVPTAFEQHHAPTCFGQAQGQGDARRSPADDAEVVIITQCFVRLIILDHAHALRKYSAGNTHPLITTKPPV